VGNKVPSEEKENDDDGLRAKKEKERMLANPKDRWIQSVGRSSFHETRGSERS